MDKYLKRLCNAILAGRFNDENYRQRKSWNGKDIMTEPLFCSYGTIGFTVSVYDCYSHFCTVEWDGDLHKLTIDGENWKDYINILYLEDNGITSCGEEEFETYTDAGEDMIITLEKIRKENLQEYVNNFDINEEVILWWCDGEKTAHEKGVPHNNIRDHYNEYEAYLRKLQKVCNKMPF